MILFRRSSFLIPRQHHVLSFQDISHKIKLLEVPDICTSEKWDNVIQESRMTLQKYLNNRPKLDLDYSNGTSALKVVKRLQLASYNSNHLINTFNYLLENSDETASVLRWPGLITLMLSQGVGYPFIADNFISKRLKDVIWSSQVVLAEIINTLHCSLVFRKENWRVSSSKKKTCYVKAMNEVDRLINNYFTSSSIYKFPALKNYKVMFLLSNVIESLAKTKPNWSSRVTNKCMWEYEVFHTRGMLLANGCQATLELAGHDDNSQQLAFEFGLLFALAIKANADIQQYYNYQMSKSTLLNLSGFPVVLHLENNPETLEYIYRYGEDVDNIAIDQLNVMFVSNSALEEAKHHLDDYVSRTLNILEQFKSWKNNDMMEYLTKLVKTLIYLNEKDEI